MSKNIITVKMFKEATERQVLEGYIYVKDFYEGIGKNKTYKRGFMDCKHPITFMLFDDIELLDDSYKDSIIYCKLTINFFNGKKNVILQPGFEKCTDPTITKEMFFSDNKYDIEENSKNFLKLLKNKLSDKGFYILSEVLELEKKEGIFNIFKTGYAATTNHDNLKGGLLAHSYKCLQILEMLENMYPWLRTFETKYLTNQDFKDLLYLGIGIHDLGKTKEINQELYLEDSFNTHRIIGHEMIISYKDLIIEAYNEHFYNLLVSIFIGHHDKYEDKARSIYAFIAHKIDEIEATFTDIDQRIDFDLLEIPVGQFIQYDEEHRLFI